MAKDYVGEYDTTAGNNTDVGGVDIAEGCAPGGINNAIREVMSHVAQIGAVNAQSANYTVIDDDDMGLVTVDATAAARTITLTAAATLGDGFYVTIKKIDSSVNTVTIDGNASETIDGQTTLVLGSQYESVTILCDGSNWHTASGASRGVFCTNTNGNPNISDTALKVDTLSEDVWTEISSSNWAALSSVPIGASWIEVRMHYTHGSSAAGDIYISARKEGADDEAVGDDNRILYVFGGGVTYRAVPTAKIPISSTRKFDLYWAAATPTGILIDMFLVGYGYN